MSKTKTPIIVQIDQAELAVRILEACFQFERPAGLDADLVLQGMKPEMRSGSLRAAETATRYVAECLTRSGVSMGGVTGGTMQ